MPARLIQSADVRAGPAQHGSGVRSIYPCVVEIFGSEFGGRLNMIESFAPMRRGARRVAHEQCKSPKLCIRDAEELVPRRERFALIVVIPKQQLTQINALLIVVKYR